MKIGSESETLEFKKTGAELKEGIISAVAMLNKHGHGELYFGVRNDGLPLGMDIGEKTLRDFSQAIGNHIEPKVFPRISDVYIDGKHCIHIVFNGDEAPYLAYGRAYIRVADEDKVMTSAGLENFYLKKNAGRDIWDGELSGKTVDDIDEAALKDYIDRANRAGRIGFTYTTKEDVLSKLEMVEDGKLKNAAYALFVGSNRIEVQMAIFAGTERLTFNDIQREHGNVTDLIRIAERYVKSNIRWRVEFDGSIERKEVPEIPVDAVREAIINSYCHRDFKSSQNNEVVIYKNRVTIYNPGTFPEGLKPEDFIEGDEPSVKRNPQLAQLMYYSKDIESFGTGLKRISAACKESGVKLEFRIMKRGFAVVFYRPDEDFNPTDKPSNVVLNVVMNVVLSEAEKAALACIIENRAMTAEQIAMRLSKSERTAQRYLDSLQKKNVIRRVGSRKDGYWEIARPER